MFNAFRALPGAEAAVPSPLVAVFVLQRLVRHRSGYFLPFDLISEQYVSSLSDNAWASHCFNCTSYCAIPVQSCSKIPTFHPCPPPPFSHLDLTEVHSTLSAQ